MKIHGSCDNVFPLFAPFPYNDVGVTALGPIAQDSCRLDLSGAYRMIASLIPQGNINTLCTLCTFFIATTLIIRFIYTGCRVYNGKALCFKYNSFQPRHTVVVRFTLQHTYT